MNAVIALIKMALKLGPLAVVYFLTSIQLFNESLHSEAFVFIIFFGTILCWMIAFAAGCIFFGPVLWWHHRHPIGQSTSEIFEKVLPVYILIFATVAGVSFFLPDTDGVLPSLGISTYLSAITGWYLLASNYFKSIENNRKQNETSAE